MNKCFPITTVEQQALKLPKSVTSSVTKIPVEASGQDMHIGCFVSYSYTVAS